MNDDTIVDIHLDLKSDRLNDDVSLWMGCTLQELLAVGCVSLIGSLLVSLMVMKLLVGSFVWGLPIGVVMFFIVYVILLSQFSRLKRDKPSGYYQQYLRMKLSHLKLLKNPYIIRSGLWSTERLFKIK